MVIKMDDNFNDWADFWYYDIGVTPIPVFSKNKNDHTKPLSKVKWAKYQNTELTEDTFAEWKSQNLFKDGIAIIGGYVWRGKNKGRYLIMIDCDNQKGIDELSPKGLDRMLQRTLIEQHKDRQDKVHIYFYSNTPVHKKIISGNEGVKGHPAIEVKGDGKHGIHIVSPSIHVDGEKYEITSVGRTPAFVVTLEEQIQKICDKFGIKYLDEQSKFGIQQTQASKYMSPDFRVGESEGRRPALLSVCGHWFWERQERLNDEETYNEVLALSVQWNELHCTVPLTEDQIKKQCSDALKKAKYYVESGEMYPPLVNNITGKTKQAFKKPKIDYNELAAELMSEYGFISHISNEIYYYSKGIYHKNGDKLIKQKSRNYWEEIGIETRHIKEIENIIRDKTMVLNFDNNKHQEIFDNDYKKIILKNGMYDFDTMELKDYDPNILATIKHPIHYDGTKQCPKFDAFLDSCFDGDEKRITQVLEMMALCFIKKYIIQKGYVNYGIGSNGKSTLLNILRNMLGLQNTSSIPMQQFQISTFMGYELRGKCANISADGGTDPITKTGYIKSILGGDSIRCEQKRKDPFDFMPFVTLIFTFNELPVVNDSSDGFARKIQTIHWDNRFYGDKRDLSVEKIAYNSNERSGIFNKLIPIIKQLIDTHTLQYESTVQETKSVWLSRSDSFFKFKNEHIIMGAKHRVEVNRVKDYYKQICEDDGMTPITDNRLFNRISEMLGGAKPIRTRIENEPIKQWFGFTLDCEMNGDQTTL